MNSTAIQVKAGISENTAMPGKWRALIDTIGAQAMLRWQDGAGFIARWDAKELTIPPMPARLSALPRVPA